ncbi:MAG: Hsp33 family molecular chaperone HslO [Clostridiales bacterium]|jgi:molecular chaperone Hsp33|nr:Hsp33 family molecular chaperone HslO [Clostridiales bacterium]
MNGDYAIRATVGGGRAVAFLARTAETVSRATEIHQAAPAAAAALGRLLTAAALLCMPLKNDSDLVTLIVSGDGPAGKITATGNRRLQVKGDIQNPAANPPPRPDGKLDAVGRGYITVIKDLGLKEPYSGRAALVSGEIAEDLAHYLTVSEQIPSAVGLGVLMENGSARAAGGFLLQAMPSLGVESSELVLSQIFTRVQKLRNITDFYGSGKTPEDLAAFLFDGLDCSVSGRLPITYYCGCTRERMERSLLSLGKAEILKIIDEDGGAVLHCHFCGTDYAFTKDDLLNISAENTSPNSPPSASAPPPP